MLEAGFHVDDDVAMVVSLIDYLTDQAADRGVGAAQSTSAAMIYLAHHKQAYPVRPGG